MREALEVAGHLSEEELEVRLRAARDVVEYRRTQIVLRRVRGERPGEIAKSLASQASAISRVIRNYNEKGPDALSDSRHGNAGAAPLLDEQALDALRQALGHPHEDGGLWNGPKVTRWIEQYLGRDPHSLSNVRGWEALKTLGFSFKSSRPSHIDAADEQTREDWKKNSPRASTSSSESTQTPR